MIISTRFFYLLQISNNFQITKIFFHLCCLIFYGDYVNQIHAESSHLISDTHVALRTKKLSLEGIVMLMCT